MDTSIILYILLGISFPMLIFIIFLITEVKKIKQLLKQAEKQNPEGSQLKLVALERLTLLTERLGLKNLVSRTEQKGLSAADYYHILVETIKNEYDHNLTQQIYVSPEIWNTVTRMRDQNIYIINQIISSLPPHASAIDFSKSIIEFSNTPNAEMNALLLDALQFEAKKILN